MTGVGSWHDPLVVWLVQRLVEKLRVQSAVDQVDEEVGKEEEQRKLEVVVPQARSIFSSVVELRISHNLGQEEGRGADGHDGESLVSLPDFHADLVLQELGVLEGVLVEDEEVGERGKDIVYEKTKDPGDVALDQNLTGHMVRDQPCY